MIRWAVDRIVHFDFQRDIVKSGLAHFGFYDRQGTSMRREVVRGLQPGGIAFCYSAS